MRQSVPYPCAENVTEVSPSRSSSRRGPALSPEGLQRKVIDRHVQARRFCGRVAGQSGERDDTVDAKRRPSDVPASPLTRSWPPASRTVPRMPCADHGHFARLSETSYRSNVPSTSPLTGRPWQPKKRRYGRRCRSPWSAPRERQVTRCRRPAPRSSAFQRGRQPHPRPACLPH